VDELLILPEGLSTVTIEVIDPAGNVHTKAVQVFVDTVDPVLTIDPLPERTRDRELTVTGTAEGATVLFLGTSLITLGEGGNFSFNITLEEGSNVIELVCRDGVGHEDRASAKVVLDSTAPLLRLVLPGMDEVGNGTWRSDQRTVTVQVVSEPGASVTLNGVYVLVGEDGTANVDVTLDENADQTVITVLVEDDLGNSEELHYTVIYEGSTSITESLDLMTLISTIVIVALLVAVVVLIVRYNSMVKRMSKRRRPPRRRNGNGRPRNGANGVNGNGGGSP
jgi:hypothetical protein